jgi:hypothetical protein
LKQKFDFQTKKEPRGEHRAAFFHAKTLVYEANSMNPKQTGAQLSEPCPLRFTRRIRQSAEKAGTSLFALCFIFTFCCLSVLLFCCFF